LQAWLIIPKSRHGGLNVGDAVSLLTGVQVSILCGFPVTLCFGSRLTSERQSDRTWPSYPVSGLEVNKVFNESDFSKISVKI
jgi:hypothetical protein